MIRDYFVVNSESNTIKDGIEITITINNGKFATNSNVCVFFGLPPGYLPPHPVTDCTTVTNKLGFTGNINSLYCETDVESNDDRLYGTITVKPALFVSVYISSSGGGGRFELPAGQTSAQFKIPIANYGTEGEVERTRRIAKVIGRTE
jgi:hypothetical protein